MIIQYELKRDSTGVITSDPQTVTDREIILSFSLPAEAAGEYFAVIIGQDGKDSKIRLNNLKCALPNKFIKSQSLRIEVLQVVDERIVKRWTCQGIRLALLDDMLKLTYEVVIDYNALQELYTGLVYKVDEQAANTALVIAENERLQAELAKSRDNLKAEVTKDIGDLLAFKKTITAEIVKLVNSVNGLADELNNVKSEFNL